MKNDLPYFQHNNDASQHPKMRALIAEYGYMGYGMFWALNEKIARTEGAKLDISRKVYRNDLAYELRLTVEELEKFLAFLSDPEIDLINIIDNKITTDRITDQYEFTMGKRKKQRKSDNGEINGDFDKIDSDNGEINGDFDTYNIIEYNIKEKDSKEYNTESKKQSLELSKLLLDLHRKQIPDFLNGKDDVNIKRWAEDIEKLIRIDKKPPENIKLVIEYAKTPNNFWFPNIISGKKLREKYETLWAQLNTKNQNKPPTYKHKIASDEVTDYEQYIKKPEEDDTS